MKTMMNEAMAGPNTLLRAGTPTLVARPYQQGVVLLALILVVLVGSSAVLLGKLNESAQDYARDVQTQAALKQAKEALIRYAVIYPEIYDESGEKSRVPGPGYLPCPDHDDDGQGEPNCSDSAGTTGSTLGRLPTQDLGLDTLVDSSGERLWYSVSQSFKKYQLSSHVLNSSTSGTISVDGSDDIVAVVMAPGAPVDGQDTRHGNDEEAAIADPDDEIYLASIADQYLEDENAINGDQSYVTGSTVLISPSQCTDGSLDDDQVEVQCFNDQIITITRGELMAAVEARVANEVRGVLASYRDTAGAAFPWLAPFADPKRAGRHAASLGGYGLSGRHTSDTTSTVTLTDNKANFEYSGVDNGDLVWNLTDGSFGTITDVTATSVTVASLSGGADNEFSQQDAYYIDAVAPEIAAPFDGQAGAASSGTTLVAYDPVAAENVDMEKFGVVPGDVIDFSDGTSGTVVNVSGDEVELDSGVTVTAGQGYRVRSAIGVAGDNSLYTTLTLVDNDVDFMTLGVKVDDRVYNLTDGSYGVVSAAPAAHTLTVSALYGGTDNTFEADEGYAISRYTSVDSSPSVHYGLLPLHETGKAYGSQFSVKWSLTATNGNTISVPTVDDYSVAFATTYNTGRTNWIESSTSYSDATGADSTYPDAVVAETEVDCIWLAPGIVDCTGKYEDQEFLKAKAESVSLSGSIYYITDTGTRFNYSGVRSGARIRNLDQLALGMGEGVVYSASSTTQNIVRAVAVDDGGTLFSVSPGESVQVLVASKRSPATGGHIADGATAPNLACYTGANFDSFVEPGDTIRLNSSLYGNPIGRIIDPITADCVTYTDLQGGTSTSISVGQSFRILYDFVEERRWEFKVRMAGSGMASEPASAGVRERSVCQGFGADCDSQYAETLYTPETGPVISFTDYDISANKLGTASVAIPAAGASTGSLLAGGLDYLLAADLDADTDDGLLPRWFLRNRWHEYVFISYAEPRSPDNATDCTAGTDCVQINVPAYPTVIVKDNLEAVVAVAGSELATQNRTLGTLENYLEYSNSDAEAVTEHAFFERADVDATFNDQLSAVVQE